MKILAIAVALLILALPASASPGKLDKFGCHTCTTECAVNDLLQKEYHCHGTPKVQSAHVQIAPRISENKTLRKVASVIDGDTIQVFYAGRKENVRLSGIDAPEAMAKAECYGGQAGSELRKMIHNKHVQVIKEGKDKYGRLLGKVILGNIVINEELVRKGTAKSYNNTYTATEQKAKNAKAGLWGMCERLNRTNS